jgi:hypothetical protein
MRQDTDERTVYHLEVIAPEDDDVLSPSHRAVYWDPATLRPRD